MDILSILKSNVNESDNISSEKFSEVATAINNAVGKEFVDKKRYNERLTEIDALKGEKQTAEDKATGAEKWKTKYDALKDDFEAYKKDVSAKESKATKENAYKKLLKEAGVSEKRIAAVLKVTDLDEIEFGEDGKLKDVDKLKESIKKEWSEFITKEETKGADTKTPPDGQGGNPHTPSRAAQVAAKRYEMLYGTKTEEKK
jgi:hypothetical protein